MHHCGLTFIHIIVLINNNNKEQDRQSQLRMFIIFTGFLLQHVSASRDHRQLTQSNEYTKKD
jgi:hypothetical protein